MLSIFEPHAVVPLIVIVAASFFAAIVKGVTTMGLGLVGVTIIAAYLDVQTAVLSMFTAKFMSDAMMLLDAKRAHGWKLTWRLRWFATVGILGVLVASYFLANLPAKALYLILGITVIGFSLLQLRKRPIKIDMRQEQAWGALFGAATGVGQGLTGIGGPPTAMYLYSMSLSASEFVFLSCVIYFLFDIGQLIAVLYLEMYNPTRIFYSLVVFPPVVVGTWVGIRLRQRISVTVFRYTVLTVLFASGISLIIRSF